MKGTLASPAVALANNVLPVPGGPTIMTTVQSVFQNSAKYSSYWRQEKYV